MQELTLDAVLWWTLKGSAIVVLAGGATLLLRRRPAAVRHGVWAVAVIAQLAVPFTERVPSVAAVTMRVPPLMLVAAPGDVSVVAAAPSQPATPDSPPISLLDVLALIGFAFLLRLLAGTIRVAIIARRSSRVVDGDWLSLAQELCAAAGIRRPVTLIRSERIALPVTWGVLYPTILLPAAADIWPHALRRSVLLHELAHVRRLDAATQLAGQLALALFWFNPLVWLAVRRMRAEAEHACDDYVLRDGERPSAYAATLVQLVEAHHGPGVPAFAALSVGRRSELENRVGAIVSPHRDPAASRVLVASAVVAAVVIVAPLSAIQRDVERRVALPKSKAIAGEIPCKPFVAAGFEFRQASGTLTLEGVTTHYYFLRPSPRRCIEASYSLGARFTAADDDLVPDRNLDALLREVTDSSDRRVHVTAPHGALQRQLVVDGRPTMWDGAAESWYRRMIAESVRLTSAGIPERAARIVGRGGADALFAELRNIPERMSVRRQYLEALLALRDANALPRARLIEEAQTTIVHPAELASFLRTLASREGSNPEVRDAVLAAAQTLSNEIDRALVIDALDGGDR
ncbi:MAG TPA: M56 family metallopeptidase [Thermoanaerobaculia bacterium]|nr:M56 family metallopeptidase [Thermoanaerobaculia bacterium]